MSYINSQIKPGANLKGVNLEDVTANRETHWPSGFDPVAAGVTFE